MNKSRLQQGLSKILFCLQCSTAPASFFRLLLQTKRQYRYLSSSAIKAAQPSAYSLKLEGRPVKLWLRTHNGDLQIFYEVFWQRVYDVKNIDWTACKTVIDLGGNVGMSALFFACRAPQASIWVMEPDAENFSILRRNASAFKNNIVPVQVAAAGESGTLYLAQSRYAYNSYTTRQNTGIEVAAISINDLMQQYGIAEIDLLKIDIEGSEADLFAQNTGWLRITKRLIIEIHSAKAFAVCNAALAAYHFRLRCLSGTYGSSGMYDAVK